MEMKRLILTAAVLGLTLSSNSFAQDKPPVIANKHIIPNAVQVQITQRGLKYF